MKTTIQILLSSVILFSCGSHKVAPPEAVGPVPSQKQLAWQQMEMNAFIHFTTNTFTDKEWGYGDESPEIFNPSELDAEQWARTLKQAGFKGVILTCKHHDGFCLWPSKYTEHSVKNSLWKDGKGDVVKELRDACTKYGLKFGVYMSPWDRNRTDYGQPSYVEYYRNQLKELFTGYGPVFEMWFDGANGGDGYYGGSKETRKIDGSTYYGWPTTLDMMRQIEPNVVFFSDGGPDIRWCGNESGYIGETNWCMVTKDTLYAGKPKISSFLNVGSEYGKDWVPAEVDVSIRPQWFYHAKQDSQVKTPERLLEIYLTSVGRGANLLLNIPPDRRGLFHENDVKSLLGFKELLDKTFAENFALNVKAVSENYRGNAKKYAALNVTDANPETYWATDDGINNGSLEIDLGAEKMVNYVLVQEYIKLGQRVRSFSVDVWQDNSWKNVGEATTIGYKHIMKIDAVKTQKIRVNIIDAKACPVISNVEVY